MCHEFVISELLWPPLHRWGKRGPKDPGHVQAGRKTHISCLLIPGSPQQPACPFPQYSLGGAESKGQLLGRILELEARTAISLLLAVGSK